MTAITTDTDTFEDPEPTGRQIEFDGWGRYKLPHPDTGDMTAWTRVTTLAGALEDQYHLSMWGRRKVLEGLVMDRGLLSLAAEAFATYGWDPQTQEAKKALNAITSQAVDTAGAHKGADTGTALHSITEELNQGRDDEAFSRAVDMGLRPNVVAYRDTLRQHQIRVVPEFMERVICVPELKVVGRLDNLVQEMGRELLRVFDLKSQKTMDFGAMKIAIQLAIYANGYAMFDEENWTWREMPKVDKEVATVCWLPVLESQEDKVCQLYDVDLAWGWRWAKASFQTRKARNFKPLTLRRPPSTPVRRTEETVHSVAAGHNVLDKERVLGPAVVSSGPVVLTPVPDAPESGLDWSARFRQAGTTQELAKIGKECKAAGALTPELKELGRVLRDAISVTE